MRVRIDSFKPAKGIGGRPGWPATARNRFIGAFAGGRVPTYKPSG